MSSHDLAEHNWSCLYRHAKWNTQSYKHVGTIRILSLFTRALWRLHERQSSSSSRVPSLWSHVDAEITGPHRLTANITHSLTWGFHDCMLLWARWSQKRKKKKKKRIRWTAQMLHRKNSHWCLHHIGQSKLMSLTSCILPLALDEHVAITFN